MIDAPRESTIDLRVLMFIVYKLKSVFQIIFFSLCILCIFLVNFPFPHSCSFSQWLFHLWITFLTLARVTFKRLDVNKCFHAMWTLKAALCSCSMTDVRLLT